MGPTINAERLLTRLPRERVEPIAVILHDGTGSPAAERLRDAGVRCVVDRRRRRVQRQIRWFHRTVADLRPDVFVPNLSVAGWYASETIKGWGVATVGAYRRHDTFNEAMVRRFVLGRPEQAFDGLVCVSRASRDGVDAAMQRCGIAGRTELAHIASGVPIPPASVAARNPFEVVYLGRLAQSSKRIFDVVDVMTALAKRHPSMRFRIIGDGPDESAVAAKIDAAGLRDRINLVGRIPADALPAALRGGSVVLQLSAMEGTPASLMDAMAAGLVPVARNVIGGVADLITDRVTGRLLPARSGAEEVRSAAAAIETLHADLDLWRACSTAGRDRIVSQYSDQTMIDRWSDLLDRLPRRPRPTHAFNPPRRLRLPPREPAFGGEDRRWPRPVPLRRIRVAPVETPTASDVHRAA